MSKASRIEGAVLAAAALIGASAPSLPIRHPAPEPYFGHRGTTCGKPNTDSVGRMGGPTAFSSPVDPAAERLIDALVRAAASRASTVSLVDQDEVPEQTRNSCLAALTKLKTSGRCTSDPLYLLGDGEIRQEWLCQGQVAYMLFYTIDRGRITNIWAQDDMPVIYAVPVR